MGGGAASGAKQAPLGSLRPRDLILPVSLADSFCLELSVARADLTEILLESSDFAPAGLSESVPERFARAWAPYRNRSGEQMSTADQTNRDKRFVDLLTSYQRDLNAYVFTLMAGDPATPDIVQDANVDLWAHKEDFDFSRPFLPWAFRFAHNRVLAHRKKVGRSRLVFSDEYIETLGAAMASDPIDSDRRLTALIRCVESLHGEQKWLVRERYSGGGTVKGIAARLGKTADQISARLYRIRQGLAECIERRLGSEGP